MAINFKGPFITAEQRAEEKRKNDAIAALREGVAASKHDDQVAAIKYFFLGQQEVIRQRYAQEQYDREKPKRN